MRTRRHRFRAGLPLILLGIGTLCVELGRYWLVDHPIHPWPVSLGCLFGFAGFFIVDPVAARTGATAVVGYGERIVIAVRSGRRLSDTAVVAPPPVDAGEGDEVGVAQPPLAVPTLDEKGAA